MRFIFLILYTGSKIYSGEGKDYARYLSDANMFMVQYHGKEGGNYKREFIGYSGSGNTIDTGAVGEQVEYADKANAHQQRPQKPCSVSGCHVKGYVSNKKRTGDDTNTIISYYGLQ